MLDTDTTATVLAQAAGGGEAVATFIRSWVGPIFLAALAAICAISVRKVSVLMGALGAGLLVIVVLYAPNALVNIGKGLGAAFGG